MKAETDFRDLLRKPETLFGYSFLYFLGTALLIGMLYAWNLSGMQKNAVQPLVADSTALTADLPLKSPSVLPPVDVRLVGVPSDSLVARGRDLYRANCSSCHGDNGLGDGPAGLTLNPRPRNFHLADGWTIGPRVSQIYKTLEEGIVRNGMASYNYMPPADRFALAHYVRTFGQGQPVDSPEELLALEATYQLSQGKSTAGQIPVRKATQLVLREGSSASARAEMIVNSIRGSADGAGAAVLLHHAADLKRVVTALIVRQAALPPAEVLAKLVAADPRAFGFRPSVLQISAAEWGAIRACLAQWEGVSL